MRLPRWRTVAAPVGGLLVAASLPPWGVWPLAFVGVALFELSLGEAPTRRQRAGKGWIFAACWLFPGLAWMWFLTAPGYVVAASMFAAFHAVASLISPVGRWRVIGQPAAHTLAEALRFCFPFGGVPLASLAIAEASGPFAGIVRIGGAVLLTWFVFQVGFTLGSLAPFVRRAAARGQGIAFRDQSHSLLALLAAVVLLVLVPFSSGASARHEAPTSLRVAAVQGGGPQGTHAVDTDTSLVTERHLEATRTIAPGSVDLVVWPENVIDVVEFSQSEERGEVAAEAMRIGAPIAVGVTEDAPGNRFLNAEIVVAPDGTLTGRYDKVRRVPFGEYMPMRGLLHALGAPTNLVPRDAVAGTGPAYVDAPVGDSTVRIGVVISWEVFFGGRANDGVAHGAEMIINPTNGSSYTWTILQSQQIAASRLRAIEQDRWLVQAAPTGFSAFLSPDGDVFDRTDVSEQKVITHTIELRVGRTWYSRAGDKPVVVLALAVLLLALVRSRRAT